MANVGADNQDVPPPTTGGYILIEETVAVVEGEQPRKVTLVGPSMPLKGQAKWGGDAKLSTAWYVGNGTEGTQQILVPTLMPSDFNGEWNRTRMSRTPAIYWDERGTSRNVVEPFELYELLEAIRVGGARLRVTWAATGNRFLGSVDNGGRQVPVDWSIVREGRMKSFEITPDTEVDFKWAMNWEWVSKGGRQGKAASVKRSEDLNNATTAVEQSADALDGLVDDRVTSIKGDVRMSANNLTLGQLENLADAPQNLLDDVANKIRYNVGQLRRARDIAKKFAAIPDNFQKGVENIAVDTAQAANSFVRADGQTPAELKSRSQRVSDVGRSHKRSAQISNQMVIIARERGSAEELRRSKVAAANQGQLSVQESSTTRAGDLLGIYVTKEGDTPGKVSQKYYGSPDHAGTILRANRMPPYTPQFRKGTIVIIPALTDANRER